MYRQSERPLQLETRLGPDTLLPSRLTGVERVSHPFEFHLELLSERSSLGSQELVRQPASVRLDLGEHGERLVHGLFRNITQKACGTEGLVRYEADLAPWLWFLSLSTDCRIFQDLSVPEIVERVFQRAGFRDFRFELTTSYPKREYCVQHRETHLDFVSRLLEDEGIFYFFEHSRERHTLVLADSLASVRACPGQSQIRYEPQPESWVNEDVVLEWNRRQQVIPGKVALRDYDFERPHFDLDAEASARVLGEQYDYPGKYRTPDEGQRYARLRLEEHLAGAQRASGRSQCRSLEAGYRLDLTGHYRTDLNRSYFLVAVQHEARQEGFRSGKAEGFSYENRFEAMPNDRVFRPERATRKPKVHGAQTAVVAGRKGEEVWVDRHGRVKVQFHWDREGGRDENSSCWMRVSQPWAGAGWGSMQAPRIGQEVVVDFLEGDPDRPIIVGRVYNGDQAPPWKLPQHKTASGILSRSMKEGQPRNASEIRFEDRKGEEQIVVHAERDKEESEERDAEEWVGQERRLTVGADQVELVEGGFHATVEGEQRERIGGDASLTIHGAGHESVGGTSALDAGDEVHLKTGAVLAMEAGAQLSLRGPGGWVDIGPGGVTIKGSLVRVNSGGRAVGGSGSHPRLPRVPAPPAPAASRDATPGRQHATMRLAKQFGMPFVKADCDRKP